MKSTVLLIISLAFLCCTKPSSKTSENEIENQIQVQTSTYDSILAKKVGADDYGMKKYVMAFLKRGSNTSLDSITRAKLQRAHLDNIKKLAKEEKLIVAGPFFGNDSLRGIYIFDVQSIEEAKQLTNTDPSIQAGILKMELKEWYGSAALSLLTKEHKKIAKKEI